MLPLVDISQLSRARPQKNFRVQRMSSPHVDHGSELLRNKENPRILVIALRRLGDVLLTTPLVRSLKRGVPGACIDMLVFRGTEGMLAGNPDVDAITTIAARPAAKETRDLIRTLWRRYDLAVSTQTGDRPTFLAFVAGRRRAGLVPAQGGGGWWKQYALNLCVPADPDSHRVVELLGLARALGVPSIPELVPPAAASEAGRPQGRYAVLHANPLYRFRRWTDEGWRALAHALAERRLKVFATGGPDPAERAYLDRVWNGVDPPVERLDGKLDWPQLATLIRGGAVYVGPDTSMTHLAAATGCPTIGLYGPASPHVIGPWPIGRGHAPARSSGAATCGWCRTRCRAFRASGWGAKGIMRAAANASTSCRRGKCWPRSIRPSRPSQPVSRPSEFLQRDRQSSFIGAHAVGVRANVGTQGRDARRL
jgi:heptosyltransferase-3